MHGPEVKSFDVLADPVQAVLGAQVVESALPARVVVEPLPSQCVVVDDELGPYTGQVEARVPIATNLRAEKESIGMICRSWIAGNLPDWRSIVLERPDM